MWIYDFIPSDWAAIRSDVLYIHWLYMTDQLQPIAYAYFSLGIHIIKDGMIMAYAPLAFKSLKKTNE